MGCIISILQVEGPNDELGHWSVDDAFLRTAPAADHDVMGIANVWTMIGTNANSLNVSLSFAFSF
jgi:hypothetical protein